MPQIKQTIRSDFPILERKIGDNKLVYLDNAATTQKPLQVINALTNYYTNVNSNVHRGAHKLADEATELFEDARYKVKCFINANATEEIIFTRGVTESINLVANVLTADMNDESEIIISELEHHANIVPWQLLAKRSGAKLKVCRISDDGNLDIYDLKNKLNMHTKLVAISHVSNALGTLLPIDEVIKLSHANGAKVLIDGAQAVAHLDVDVRMLDCDFYTFSGHKLFGPTGIGILYGKKEILEVLPPWQAGGEMIDRVTFEETTFNQLPYKFEAGTPNIAGAVGLGVAIDYLARIDLSDLRHAEHLLVLMALEELRKIDGIQIVGNPSYRVSIISFLIEGSHPQDVGTLLDQQGIAVRAGHHCTMPLMNRLNLPGTVRASFSLYNSEADVIRLIKGVKKVKSFV